MRTVRNSFIAIFYFICGVQVAANDLPVYGHQCPTPTEKFRSTIEPLLALSLDSKGKILVLAGGGYGRQVGEVELRDVSSLRVLRSARAHRDAIKSTSISPDGRFLATGSQDGSLKIWELPNLKLLVSLRNFGFSTLCWSFDSTLIAWATSNGIVSIWSIAENKLYASLSGLSRAHVALAFSPKENLLVIADSDDKSGHVRLWDASKRVFKAARIGSLEVVLSVAFRPDGKALACFSEDCHIRIWDIENSKSLVDMNTDAGFVAYYLCFSADGKWLYASCGRDVIVTCDLDARILYSANADIGRITCAAFDSGARLMAIGARDGTVRMWTTRPLK